jgi:arylsulfatase A-like enzyme
MADDFVTYGLDEPFPGTLGRTVDDSTEAWPMPVQAPEGAPNVLFYVLDDVGFGHLEPFGGLVRVPSVRRILDRGLGYTNFHTTGLCSPTRTCIITGRNHHSNGMGAISEWSTGFPGYDGRILPSHGFISEILNERGYNTFGLGKWHLSVATEETMAGPFDTWPMRRGFERYYGFLGAETDQWYPDLVYDNHNVTPPKTPAEGYHLSKDLADKAIEFIGDAHSIAPDKPFFMYYCPGAGHAPHHIFKEEADKYRGAFDLGWDAYREQVFANQKELGIFDDDAELSPHDPDVQVWDELPETEQALYIRMMEVWAGFVTYTDQQFGRVLDFLDDLGELDNTLVMIISDNGASPEGGVNGTLNENDFFNFIPTDVEANLAALDTLGGPDHYNHYTWGWANAGNTPYKRWKKETFRGGTTDPFVLSWPARIDGRGEFRTQYGHAIDMVPTVLDLLGVDPPESLKGVRQDPFEGVSLAPTVWDANAPEAHTTQYYEVLGSRSIYQDGWRAECGWPGPNYATGAERGHRVGDAIHADDLVELDRTWELYDLRTDPTECHDLADQHPEKLRELIDLWYSEAATYNALPLQGTIGQRVGFPRPMPGRATDKHIYFPGAPVPTLVAPNTFNRPHTITAQLHVPEGGAEGVIYANGSSAGGYALFVKDGTIHFVYNYEGHKTFRIVSDQPLPSGDVTIQYGFQVTGEPDLRNGKGAPGTGILAVNGHRAGSVDMDVTVPFIFCIEGLSVGYDYGDAVDHDNYDDAFPFTGTIGKVTFDVSGEAIHDAEAVSRRLLGRQ